MVLPMTSQRPGVAVALSTPLGGAGKRLGASVCQQVTVQVVLPLEGFAADVAMVFPLLTVSQSVFGQGGGVGEGLGTDGASLRQLAATPCGSRCATPDGGR